MSPAKLFSLMVTFSLLFVQQDYAQGWIWAKSEGGSSYDNGNSVTTDAYGNVYVTGSFTSPTITFGTTTLTNSGSEDIFVVKYNAGGSVLWAKSAGGGSGDIGQSITTDGSGNAYVTGIFVSSAITFGTTTLTNDSGGGHADIFLVKYDTNGNVLWATSAGGSRNDYPGCVATDGKANIYVTGYFTSSTITFGTSTLTNSSFSGNGDIFLVKYDAAGNVLWARKAGGSGPDVARSIATDAAGNVFVTGDFNSYTIAFGTTTLSKTSSPYEDIFITKYDTAGNVLWAKSVGGIDADYATSVATDGMGNAFVTGFFTSPTIVFGSTTLTNTAATVTGDIYVVKYDASGSVLWAKKGGGSSGDLAQSITTDGSGNAYVTGFFGGPAITFGTTTLTNADSTNIDIFVVKYDGTGNVFWAKSIGSSSDYSNSISTDGSGNVYITGFFIGPTITFGGTTLTNTNSSCNDIFLAKYASTVSVPTVVNKNHNLHLYPNPTTGAITLTADNPAAITALQVYDILGRAVYENTNIESQYFSSQSLIINLADLPNGIYTISATGDKNKEYLQFGIRK